MPFGYELSDESFHRIVVGPFTICKSREGFIWIDDNEEDASEFNEADFVAHIRLFYDANF